MALFSIGLMQRVGGAAPFNLAHEWYQQVLFEAYSGDERRVSVIDRRSDRDKRDLMVRNYISSQANPHGRRASDVAAEVD